MSSTPAASTLAASNNSDLMCERDAAKDVRLYDLAPVVLPRLGRYNATHRRIQLAGVRAKTVGLIPGRILGVLAQYGAVALAAYQVTRHTLSLGQFTLVIAALAACRQVLHGIVADSIEIHENRHFFNELFRFWDLPPSIKQAAHVLPAPALAQRLCLEHVSFRYPGSERWVLRDLNLEIPAGSSLAIVGVNGAGKTTLIKLLARLYEPTEGRILWDGTDIRVLDLQAYRAQWSMVLQDFVHYQLSLKENISIGAAFADDAAWMDRVLGFAALETLMRLGQRYRRLFDTQARGYASSAAQSVALAGENQDAVRR